MVSPLEIGNCERDREKVRKTKSRVINNFVTHLEYDIGCDDNRFKDNMAVVLNWGAAANKGAVR